MKDNLKKSAETAMEELNFDDLETVAGGGGIIQGYGEFIGKKQIKYCGAFDSSEEAEEAARGGSIYCM